MDIEVLKWQILRGSLAKRLLLRALMFAMALIVVSFVHIAHDARAVEPVVWNSDECPLTLSIGSFPFLNLSFALPISNPMRCEKTENLTKNVFKDLMQKGLLNSGAKALCVGEESSTAVSALQKLGFHNAIGVYKHPFFSLLRKRFVYDLDFKDDYFDFVFSRALDGVSIPSLLVREIERVLRPGGTGAMLIGSPKFYSGSLIRSVTPISLFLKNSNIEHVCSLGSFTLVIFKKKINSNLIPSFEQYGLPDECPSIKNNKPLMKKIEHLGSNLSYLPDFMNISSRKRLIYINIGAGEFVNSSIENLLKPHYPISGREFEIFVIDHNISALTKYVKNPGITFVYHPELAGEKIKIKIASDGLDSDEYMGAPPDEEGFDFVSWFKETIWDGDFVILMMNARVAEMNILFDLFKTGEICRVDELFLRCSDSLPGNCLSLFKSLRNSGVFVHRFFGD